MRIAGRGATARSKTSRQNENQCYKICRHIQAGNAIRDGGRQAQSRQHCGSRRRNQRQKLRNKP